MPKTLSKLLSAATLIACSVLFGCGKSSPSGSSLSLHSSSQGYFKTPWQDESQFIVQTIVADLAEMAFYAKNKNLPPPGQFSIVVQEKSDSSIDSPSYSVQITLAKSISPVKSDLAVNAPIWSAEVYTNLLRTIFDSVGATSAGLVTPGPQDNSLISSLTNLTARNLQEQ